MFKNIKLSNLIIIVPAAVIFIFIFIFHKPVPSARSYKSLIKIEKQYGNKNKKTVIEDLNIGKFSESPPAFYPVGSFFGKLKRAGTVKIVIGISGRNGKLLRNALRNVFYILKYVREHKIKYKIKIVLYGAAVEKLKAEKYKTSDNFRLFQQEYRKGVKFYADYNSLIINHLIRPQIPYFITPVPSGILKIYVLEKEGYLYFM